MKQDEFIRRSNIKHNYKYDYNSVEYKRNSIKVKILCHKHGQFEQRPKNHMDGQGCRPCSIESMYLTTDIFIERGNIIHNNRYNYDKVIYKKNDEKVKIICNKHGEFEQSPNHHLNMKQGCLDCKLEESRVDYNYFIEKSTLVHGNKYDYSLVNQTDFKFINKVDIICSKHGIFSQLPGRHYNGEHGCPTCRESKGEIEISNFLHKNNINFIREHKFESCRNKKELPFDFFLTDLNICIEYQGKQHYEPIDIFGGEKRFKDQLANDEIKNEYCINNNIKLIRIPYYDFGRIYDILKQLLNKHRSI